MSVRRLNEPVPARVQLGCDDRPDVVAWHPHSSARGQVRTDRVEHVLDVWYVDDGWWSGAPIRRMYYECQLAAGARLIVVYDLEAERWFVQR